MGKALVKIKLNIIQIILWNKFHSPEEARFGLDSSQAGIKVLGTPAYCRVSWLGVRDDVVQITRSRTGSISARKSA